MSKPCIFCSVSVDEFKVIYEDTEFVAFHDINPSAKIHFLVIPRRHIMNVDTLDSTDKDIALAERMHEIGLELLEKFGCSDIRLGYHVPPFNSVMHVHLHALGLPWISMVRSWNTPKNSLVSLVKMDYSLTDTAVTIRSWLKLYQIECPIPAEQSPGGESGAVVDFLKNGSVLMQLSEKLGLCTDDGDGNVSSSNLVETATLNPKSSWDTRFECVAIENICTFLNVTTKGLSSNVDKKTLEEALFSPFDLLHGANVAKVFSYLGLLVSNFPKPPDVDAELVKNECALLPENISDSRVALTQGILKLVEFSTDFSSLNPKSRSKMLSRFFESEKIYLEYLMAMDTVLLKQLAGRQSLISAKDLGTLLGNLTDLESFHASHFRNLTDIYELVKRKTTDSTSSLQTENASLLGRAISNLVQGFDLYKFYLANLSDAQSLVHKLSSKRGFREFLQAQQLDFGILDIILNPYKRLLHYPVLMFSLVKCTPNDHPDFVFFQKAASQSRKILKDVLEAKLKKRNLVVQQIIKNKLDKPVQSPASPDSFYADLFDAHGVLKHAKLGYLLYDGLLKMFPDEPHRKEYGFLFEKIFLVVGMDLLVDTVKLTTQTSWRVNEAYSVSSVALKSDPDQTALQIVPKVGEESLYLMDNGLVEKWMEAWNVCCSRQRNIIGLLGQYDSSPTNVKIRGLINQVIEPSLASQTDERHAFKTLVELAQMGSGGEAYFGLGKTSVPSTHSSTGSATENLALERSLSRHSSNKSRTESIREGSGKEPAKTVAPIKKKRAPEKLDLDSDTEEEDEDKDSDDELFQNGISIKQVKKNKKSLNKARSLMGVGAQQPPPEEASKRSKKDKKKREMVIDDRKVVGSSARLSGESEESTKSVKIFGLLKRPFRFGSSSEPSLNLTAETPKPAAVAIGSVDATVSSSSEREMSSKPNLSSRKQSVADTVSVITNETKSTALTTSSDLIESFEVEEFITTASNRRVLESHVEYSREDILGISGKSNVRDLTVDNFDDMPTTVPQAIPTQITSTMRNTISQLPDKPRTNSIQTEGGSNENLTAFRDRAVSHANSVASTSTNSSRNKKKFDMFGVPLPFKRSNDSVSSKSRDSVSTAHSESSRVVTVRVFLDDKTSYKTVPITDETTASDLIMHVLRKNGVAEDLLDFYQIYEETPENVGLALNASGELTNANGAVRKKKGFRLMKNSSVMDLYQWWLQTGTSESRVLILRKEATKVLTLDQKVQLSAAADPTNQAARAAVMSKSETDGSLILETVHEEKAPSPDTFQSMRKVAVLAQQETNHDSHSAVPFSSLAEVGVTIAWTDADLEEFISSVYGCYSMPSLVTFDAFDKYIPDSFSRASTVATSGYMSRKTTKSDEMKRPPRTPLTAENKEVLKLLDNLIDELDLFLSVELLFSPLPNETLPALPNDGIEMSPTEEEATDCLPELRPRFESQDLDESISKIEESLGKVTPSITRAYDEESVESDVNNTRILDGNLTVLSILEQRRQRKLEAAATVESEYTIMSGAEANVPTLSLERTKNMTPPVESQVISPTPHQ